MQLIHQTARCLCIVAGDVDNTPAHNPTPTLEHSLSPFCDSLDCACSVAERASRRAQHLTLPCASYPAMALTVSVFGIWL